MTKYLDSKPFSSKAATDAYRDGYEATFGRRVKCARCKIVGRPAEGRRAPHGWMFVGKVGGAEEWKCGECQGAADERDGVE